MSKRWTGMGIVVAAAVVFAYVVLQQDWWAATLEHLFPSLPQAVFPSATVAQLVGQHLAIVIISSGLTIAVGIPLAIWVTRPSGRDFRDLVAAAVDFGQTFPPVAVLALMFPVLGLGTAPAIVALFLYGLFPVVSNTVAGIEGVPGDVRDAAWGLGMGKWHVLFLVELPLASRAIMAGIRTSVIINIGTATVAAAAGAGGLGQPLFSGINLQNPGFLLEGAVAAGMLAILADAILGRVDALLAPPGT